MAFEIVNMMINKVPYPVYRYGTLLRCYIHMLAIKLLPFFECQAVSMPSTEVLLIGLVIILLFLQLLSLFIFKWRNRSKRREGIAPSGFLTVNRMGELSEGISPKYLALKSFNSSSFTNC
jgi:hypothetical protein